MRIKFLLLFLLFNSVLILFGQAVPHYSFDITINPEEGYGFANVLLTVPETWQDDKIYIRLFLNLAENKNPYIHQMNQINSIDGVSCSKAEISNLYVNSNPQNVEYVEHESAVIQKYNEEHLDIVISLPEDRCKKLKLNSTINFIFSTACIIPVHFILNTCFMIKLPGFLPI